MSRCFPATFENFPGKAPLGNAICVRPQGGDQADLCGRPNKAVDQDADGLRQESALRCSQGSDNPMSVPRPLARMHDRASGHRTPERALGGLVVLLASFATFNTATVWNLGSHSNIVEDEWAEAVPLAKSIQTLGNLLHHSTGRLDPPREPRGLSQVPRVLAFDYRFPAGSAGEHAMRNGIGTPLRC